MSSAVESCDTGYRVRGNVGDNNIVQQNIVCTENGLWNITGCERKGKVIPPFNRQNMQMPLNIILNNSERLCTNLLASD